YYFLVDRLSRLHEFVGDLVGMDEMCAQRHKHFAHYGFAAGNASGQADLYHASGSGHGFFSLAKVNTNSPRRHGENSFLGYCDIRASEWLSMPNWMSGVVHDSVTPWRSIQAFDNAGISAARRNFIARNVFTIS